MKSYKQDDLIDKKILYINTAVNRFSVHEGKINEFSPSGKCIKINHEWYLLEKISFLEVFKDDERPGLKFTINR